MKLSIRQALSFGYTAPFQHAVFAQIFLSLVAIENAVFYGAHTFMGPIARHVVVNLVGFWSSVVVIRVALDIYDTGTSSLYRLVDSFARIPSIFAMVFVLLLAFSFPFAALIALSAFFSKELLMQFIIPIGVIFFFVFNMVLVLILRATFAVYNVIDRGGWPFAAIKRSFLMTQGNVWRIIAGRVITGLFISVGTSLVGGLAYTVLSYTGLIVYPSFAELSQDYRIMRIICLVALVPTLFFDVALYRQMSPKGVEVQ